MAALISSNWRADTFTGDVSPFTTVRTSAYQEVESGEQNEPAHQRDWQCQLRPLLEVLHKLRDQGNTILVMEHNLDVIKTADWIVDLGPEGGASGGEIIAVGTPEQIVAEPRSYTGQALRTTLPDVKQGRAASAK